MQQGVFVNGNLIDEKVAEETVKDICQILDGNSLDYAMYVLDMCREKIGSLAIIKSNAP